MTWKVIYEFVWVNQKCTGSTDNKNRLIKYKYKKLKIEIDKINVWIGRKGLVWKYDYKTVFHIAKI